MSTRYVWGRYSRNFVLSLARKRSHSINSGFVRELNDGLTGSWDESTAVDVSSGSISLINPTRKSVSPNYYEINDFSYMIPAGTYMKSAVFGGANGTIYIDTNTNITGDGELSTLSGYAWQGNLTIRGQSCSVTSSQGTLQGYASSASSGAYPQDGISGNYWYEYAGSDNIDAASVGYSTLEPRGGETVTINVTPSSGKVYSGTVSYLYQVQLDGGAWTTIATTTATSQSYTIPTGTQTFAARVRAQDNIGFTSSTYTTGATVTVKNSNAFVGVGGVVRNVEPRVCVNGVIYTNVTSYVCVDGVIRQS